MILAGDVGGTKVHLALFNWVDQRVEPERERTFSSGDYETFEDLLEDFLAPPDQDEEEQESEKEREETGGDDEHATKTGEDPGAGGEGRTSNPPGIEAACIGVAGPVIDNRTKTTNLPWILDGKELAARFKIPYVQLLNDLVATSYGLLTLRPDELEVLNQGTRRESRAAMALIAAGTGLGEATLFWDGKRYQPLPSEGGHADFAPTSDLQIDLLRYLKTKHLHVSYERVLSGEGLQNIYEFLRDSKKNEPTWIAERMKVGDPPAIIAEAGLKKQAEIATQALDLFASVYGAESGNVALKTMALDGVFLGGGIAPKLIAKLRDGTFMKAFTAKGRYKRLLSSIPVRVIMNQQTALLGSAAVAAQIRKGPAP